MQFNKKDLLLLSSTVIASGLSFMAGSLISLVLPDIQQFFELNFNFLQWVYNGYLLPLTVIILISGAFGDKFGKKKIMVIGFITLIIGSILSFSSYLLISINFLIFSHFTIGVGAAMMIPQSLAIINVYFDKSVKSTAIGVWAGLSAGLSTLAPLIAAPLIDSVGWQTIYILLIILAISGLLLAIKYAPDQKEFHDKEIDYYGVAALTIFLLSLVYFLVQGPVVGWDDNSVILSIIISFVFLILFILIQKISTKPLIPTEFISKRKIIVANIFTLFLYSGATGLSIFLIMYFKQILNFSTLYASLAFLPMSLSLALLTGPTGRLADKIGPRLPMIIGPILFAIGQTVLLFISSDSKYFPNIFIAILLTGIGFSIFVPALTQVAIDVEEKYSSLASGFNNAVSRFSGLIAAAVFGMIIVVIFNASITDSTNNLDINNETKSVILDQSDKLLEIDIPNELRFEVKEKIENKINTSFITGLRAIFILNIILSTGASLMSFVFIDNHKYEETKVE